MTHVVGLGCDVVDIDSFASQLSEPGSLPGAFSAAEHAVVTKRSAAFAPQVRAQLETASYAARWAAKEAVVKAWSTALLGCAPVLADTAEIWPQIEILKDRWRRPYVRLSRQLERAIAQSLCCAIEEMTWLISISHDGPTAYATAILQVTSSEEKR